MSDEYVPFGPPESSTEVKYKYTHNLPELFAARKISLILTAPRSNRVIVLSVVGEKLNLTPQAFNHPTGLAYSNVGLALCTRYQIRVFRNAGKVRDEAGNKLDYDLILSPRVSYITGDINAHEVSWAGGTPVIVNTRFSCLAIPALDASFLPIWRPSFISSTAADDRCHLNGVAGYDGKIRFVTALSTTDSKQGWQGRESSDGVLVDTASGEVVSGGIFMPNSPRIHGGRVWLIETGKGELQVVDIGSGKRETVAKFAGYIRGLAFIDELAFVLSSQPRKGGLISNNRGHPSQESLCGVHIIDVNQGSAVGFIHFVEGIEELFEIVLIPGCLNPLLVGMHDRLVDGLFVLPPAKPSESTEK